MANAIRAIMEPKLTPQKYYRASVPRNISRYFAVHASIDHLREP